MIKIALGEPAQPVIGAAGVDHVGHQLGVVVRSDLDAAAREDLPVELEILADLEHARVREQRLERLERVAFGNLIGHDVAAEQRAVAALPALAMTERHVARLIRPDRERETAQLGLHRIETRGLRVDGDKAVLARALDPGLEPVEAAHGLVSRAVEFFAARRRKACSRERLRRQRTFGFLAFRAAGAVGRRRRPVERKLRRRACAVTARGPAAFAILARGGRGYRRGTSRQPRLGRDLGGIDAGKLGDAPRQPVELHRLEEGDEPLVVGLMHGEIADRHVEHHVIVEGDELLRQARVFRVLDQRLPALLLLDLGNAR